MSMNPRLLRPRSTAGWSWANGIGSRFLVLNNTGLSITASATANTPGAWVQYIANNAISASDTIQALHIQAIGNNQVSGADNSALIDIGVGAAGSEVIIAEGIAVGGAANSGGAGPHMHIPVRIPGATRVALRTRAAVGSRIITVQQVVASGPLSGVPFAFPLPTALDVIGTSATTSRGTSMSGASGTWTEILSATSRAYQALAIVPSVSGGFTGGTSLTYLLELGIGAAGQEAAVAYSVGTLSANGIIFPLPVAAPNTIYGANVPVGTRIAVRHNAPSNPERLAACVIGVPYA
jgi:hypothetical protein